ncbi:HIT domain-containing protein [Pseudoteredinibacter isoporae]|uniref:Diadenosine tetraphosphate (Ap4A) HIT family hydrolase n=1 Tax=Pseudoteredinibacter isoporae TaxID=570281 RepID=A0A7X0JWK5_9GAMM|nr:HIT family protein [Pseudoteredinibacter isoporae]MBB6522621.1 diadenosine tetraphosphate (Ap4A) HIT family hydrolase [Pseudoteredinibacter isoporae]
MDETMDTQPFELDPQLAESTVVVGHFPLSLVLLSKDANFPWCLLVPKRANHTEMHHLSETDRQQFAHESGYLSEAMVALFAPDKMNMAALGNHVSQLHIHHVARFKDDPAWPNPIWGAVPAKAYDEDELASRLSRLRSALACDFFIPDEG